MIVISQALSLSPTSESLATPIFGWDNIVTASTIAATSEDADHPATNLANPSTALRWVAEEEGSPLGPPAADQYLTVTISQVDDVDYLAVAVHNFGTGQNTVSVEGSTGGSPEWFELVEESIPANDDPIIFRFTPQSLTGIRLRIQTSAATTPTTPYAAVLYVGKLLVCERGTSVDHIPINLGRTSNVMTGKSATGNYLGRIVLSEARATTFALKMLRASWYRANMDAFVTASKEDPFFFAWKPQELPGDVGFCAMTNDPQPTRHFDTGTFAISFQMGGVAV
jgi:hypothetical protein